MTHTNRSLARFTAALVVAILVAMAALPSIAMADAPRDVWAAVFVGLHDLEDGMEPTLVISAVVRPGTQPPVEAALAIPKGAQISWAGSILGGDPADDPMLDYTIEEHDAYDLVLMELVDSPRIQFEMLPPEGTVVAGEGFRQLTMDWTSAGAIDVVTMGVSAPLDTHLEQMAPVMEADIQSGDVFYSFETSPVVEAQTIEMSAVLLTGADPIVAERMAEAQDAHDAAAATETVGVDEPAVADTPETAEESAAVPIWALIAVLVIVLGGVAALLVTRIRAESASREAMREMSESDEESDG